MTPDVKSQNHVAASNDNQIESDHDHDAANKSDLLDDEEDFFDFITRYFYTNHFPIQFLLTVLDISPKHLIKYFCSLMCVPIFSTLQLVSK